VRVLGIDPGLGRCGWAVVERGAHGTVALGYGTVATRGEEAAPRLAFLAARLREVVARYEPDAFAIERLFVNANVRTAMTVGQASGVALLIAAEQGLPVTSYTPSQVKRAVTGTGTAPKSQIGYMVRALLKLNAVPTPADTADALAVALCRLHHATSLTGAEVPTGTRGGNGAAGQGAARPGEPGAGQRAASAGDQAGDPGAGRPDGAERTARGLAASTEADWLARAAPTSPWRGP
jgi:crossover junction endodeoxyribonuclease RuvC